MIQAPAYPYPIHHVRLFNNAHIAYLDEGAGDKTLLFIHGLANYAASWRHNMEELKQHFRCISIDLPGNGLSDSVKNAYSISFFSGCIIDFIGRLNLKNVCLIGHSMGGQIALRMAIDVPGCAERLVLCAPAGFEQFSEMDKLFYKQSMQYMSWFTNDEYNLQETLRNSFYRFPEAADKMLQDLTAIMRRQQISDYRRMLDQCVLSMINEPIFNQLKSVNHPALVLFGAMDGLIPNKMLHPVSTKTIGQQGVQQMKNATLELIPDCGHFLQWEKAPVVNQLVLKWLS